MTILRSLEYQKRFNYAMEILKNNGISTINDRMCLTGIGAGTKIVIHSVDLCNTISIKPSLTLAKVKEIVEREIELTKNYRLENGIAENQPLWKQQKAVN